MDALTKADALSIEIELAHQQKPKDIELIVFLSDKIDFYMEKHDGRSN